MNENTSQNSVWNLITELSRKDGISEIVINDVNRVFVEREGQFIQLNVEINKKDIKGFIEEVAAYNRKLCDKDNPIMDGSLPDGSRINIINEPFAQGSPSITIRRYLKHITNFDKDNSIFGLSPEWVMFLKALVHSKMNIVVSGGTGVGKTTFLNLLLQEISTSERIITIEDTIELNLNNQNSVRLESRLSSLASKESLSTRDLVKNTLRMRPDRIILGEIRGGELFDLLQAMNTGHEGSMTSIHANTPADCLDRMETLFLLSGHDLPYKVVRKQLSQAVDFIVQITRDREGNRCISNISELNGMEGDTILMSHIAELEDNSLKFTGLPPQRIEQIAKHSEIEIDFFSEI